MLSKILIANRGEIALRVIYACRELGIRTVAVYSEADEHALHVRFADEEVCIGPARPMQSYLNVPAIITAAQVTARKGFIPATGSCRRVRIWPRRPKPVESRSSDPARGVTPAWRQGACPARDEAGRGPGAGRHHSAARDVVSGAESRAEARVSADRQGIGRRRRERGCGLFVTPRT